MQARKAALVAVDRPTARGAFGVASRSPTGWPQGSRIATDLASRPPGDAEEMQSRCTSPVRRTVPSATTCSFSAERTVHEVYYDI